MKTKSFAVPRLAQCGRRIGIGIAVALMISTCALAQRSDRLRLHDRLESQPSAIVPGAVEHTIAVGGIERSYLLLDARRSGAPAPLVIVLHGGGGNGGTMLLRWQTKARAEGLLVAAPNGIGRSARMGTWNAVGCCGEAMTSGSDDVRFVSAVIEDIVSTGRVDGNRVYVAGMSNGGMLTYRVALALSDRLAGAAVVAGAMFGGEAQPALPVPILIMHGMQDDVVGFEGGISPTRFVARAQSKPFEPVRYAVDFWRRADGCTRAPSAMTQGDVTVEISNDCRAGSEVRFYRLASARHTWPSRTHAAAPALQDKAYDAIDATDVIFDFFNAHARNSVRAAGTPAVPNTTPR